MIGTTQRKVEVGLSVTVRELYRSQRRSLTQLDTPESKGGGSVQITSEDEAGNDDSDHGGKADLRELPHDGKVMRLRAAAT